MEAVGTIHAMDTRDSHLPRALKLDAFLAMQCLGDKILAAVKSSVTFMTTRSTWLLPHLPLVVAIMVNGSVKWRGVSITYTAVRDADASAERDGRVDGISRGTGKGLTRLLNGWGQKPAAYNGRIRRT